jgi:hypothetical protein
MPAIDESDKSPPDLRFVSFRRTNQTGIIHATVTDHKFIVEEIGGGQGIRTPGLIVANDALSQLS